VLGHDSFLALLDRLCEEDPPGTNHPVREHQSRIGALLQELLQELAANGKRLPQQPPTLVAEQIKDHIAHGLLATEALDLVRVGPVVPSQERFEVRQTPGQQNEFSVQDGAFRQAPQDVEFRVAGGVVGPFSAPQLPARRLPRRQGTNAVPFDLEEPLGRIKRLAPDRQYSYDAANQLTWDSSATPTFTYEGAGNRTNSGYTTDAGNRLTNDGTWTYTYDAEGNLTKKSKGAEDETWWYGYDHRNQLTSAIKRDEDDDEAAIQREAEYKYDVYANRIVQNVNTNAVAGWEIEEQHYALDGWKILQGPLGDRRALRGNENWDIWADLDGLNSDALKTRNIHGDAIDQVFARIGAPGTSTETNWLLSDRLGTVRNIADSSGADINAIAYDGFGNIISQTDSAKTGRYTFTSREKDYETGLQHHRARYYDPKTARWIS